MRPSTHERNRWITGALHQQVFFCVARTGISGLSILYAEFNSWCDCWCPNHMDKIAIWNDTIEEYEAGCVLLDLTCEPNRHTINP